MICLPPNPPRFTMLPWVLVALLPCLLNGCAALQASTQPAKAIPRNESLRNMDPARIQVDTMGFADRFVATMSGVYDEIERGAATPTARDAAHQLKTDLTLGAFSAAVNPRPIAGMIDLVVLVTLFRQVAEDPWTTEIFGPAAPRLVSALRRQELDIHTMARRYLTDDQLQELADLAQNWHRTHPKDRAVSRVHLADLPEANPTPEVAAKMANSILGLLFSDPTAGLDPAVREIELSRATSERMFFYLQRLPLLLQLQVESSYRLILETPELKRLLDDFSSASAGASGAAATAGRFADAVDRFPRELAEERHQALDEAASQFARQRDATLERFAAALAAERDQALRQAAQTTRQEQTAFVANAEATLTRTVDRLLLGAGLLLFLALFAVALLLVFFSRRHPTSPGSHVAPPSRQSL